MLHLIASLRIKPGTGAKVVAAATPCILATRREEGCLRYEMFIDPMDETNVVFVEEWESRELLGRHIETPHVAAWHAAGKPYILSEKVEVIYPERTELLSS